MTGSVQVVGPDGIPVKVDKSKRMGTIEFAHMATHDDVLVTASDYVADVDIAAPLNYRIQPAAGVDLHAVLVIGASGPCLIEVFRGPTASGGTSVLYMRHNQNSAKVTAEVLFRNPTVGATGTKVYQTRLPGTTGGQPSSRIGGQTRADEEMVIPAASPMLIRITAEADNTKVSLEMEYYETAV